MKNDNDKREKALADRIENRPPLTLLELAADIASFDAGYDAAKAETDARAERRFRAAVANWKLVAETFEAERDAALAVIEQVGNIICTDESEANRSQFSVKIQRVINATAPADALAEHDRVIAEKAWDACEEGVLSSLSSASAFTLPPNPYRANPEPTDSTKEAEHG